MTFQIRHDGRTFTVHTEVGEERPTRVLFQEDQPQQQAEQSLDSSEEPEHG